MLDDATIEANVAGIERTLATLLRDRGAPTQGHIMNNLDWFGESARLKGPPPNLQGGRRSGGARAFQALPPRPARLRHFQSPSSAVAVRAGPSGGGGGGLHPRAGILTGRGPSGRRARACAHACLKLEADPTTALSARAARPTVPRS